MKLNPYKNTLEKVKALLKTDDNLTTKQCEMFQWQLLIKVKDYTFFVGKGGITTMFYSASNTERMTCYPDQMLDILTELSKSKVFVYEALNKKKKSLGYSIDLKTAKKIKGVRYISAVNFKGKKKIIETKEDGLFGKSVWNKN